MVFNVMFLLHAVAFVAVHSRELSPATIGFRYQHLLECERFRFEYACCAVVVGMGM